MYKYILNENVKLEKKRYSLVKRKKKGLMFVIEKS